MAQVSASAPSPDAPAKKRGVAHAFVCNLPMVVTPDQHKVLNQRLEALRQIYNGVLGKMLGRLVHLRTSPGWTHARKLRDGCWFGDVVGSHDTQTAGAWAAVVAHPALLLDEGDAWEIHQTLENAPEMLAGLRARLSGV